MSQTKLGALKISAATAGVAVAEYVRLRDSGMKFCGIDRIWHPISAYARDSSRSDGLVPVCREAKSRVARSTYVARPRPYPGRSFVPARSGDRKQARRRVNYFVDAGLIPDPNDLPCTDCGHVWTEGAKRHEYDHYLGYEAEHHEYVQAVCSTCHHARERRRGE